MEDYGHVLGSRTSGGNAIAHWATPSSSSGPAAPAAASQGTPTGFVAMPNEILTGIFSDPCLTATDWKSLRLTNRIFGQSVNCLMFRRVGISKLVRDRDAFLGVAAAPHLAEHVRELVWYELDDYALCNHDAWVHTDMNLPIGDCASLFWTFSPLPTDQMPKGGKAELQGQYAHLRQLWAFVPQFKKALSAMSNIHTVVIQPMPVWRTVSEPGDPYTVTLNPHWVPGAGNNPDGREDFFMRYMYMTDMDLKIQNLIWTDDGPGPQDGLDHQDNWALSLNARNARDLQLDARAARSLKTVRISLRKAAVHEDVLGDFLRTAQELRDLTINSWPDVLGTESTIWPKLRSLRLTGLSEAKGDDFFVALVKNHAKTLRNLTLEECKVTCGIVEHLKTIEGLKLESLRVSYEHANRVISEQDLLSYLRGESSYCNFQANHNSEDEDWDYDWNDDADHSSNSDSSDNELVTVFATHVLIAFFEDPPAEYGDGDEGDGDRWNVHTDCDEGDRDLNEEFGCAPAPRWKWGSFVPQNNFMPGLYLWPVEHDEPNSHATYRFTSRDGEVGYGTEPLEFWEEWDPSCGDVAEPLSIEDVANQSFWDQMLVDDSDENFWEGPLSTCSPEGGHAREWLQDPRNLCREPLIRQQGPPDGAILVVPDSPGCQADDNPVSQEIENEGLLE
ncbi:hypothetical protein QBC46DRAFT_416061 [Diplogelasinospora grovesii]|uniref:F-box domain-containing protein n=1 Tax=Diplogelasinospora grovesii TaxID=303347 RepID=A0AAN6S1Y3_9PEZI|nr:hypothetical protein QBC46DRAFT_416061 [Diplogelasinospora grovesii]